MAQISSSFFPATANFKEEFPRKLLLLPEGDRFRRQSLVEPEVVDERLFCDVELLRRSLNGFSAAYLPALDLEPDVMGAMLRLLHTPESRRVSALSRPSCAAWSMNSGSRRDESRRRKAFLDMLGIAEFEANLRRKRQTEGFAAAKARPRP